MYVAYQCVINYHRNRSLKEQLKALRVKEAEDMKALEDMVQKVEENLVATTVSFSLLCGMELQPQTNAFLLSHKIWKRKPRFEANGVCIGRAWECSSLKKTGG